VGDAASATPAILRDEGDAADEAVDDGVPLLLGFGVMALLLPLGAFDLGLRHVRGCESAGCTCFFQASSEMQKTIQAGGGKVGGRGRECRIGCVLWRMIVWTQGEGGDWEMCSRRKLCTFCLCLALPVQQSVARATHPPFACPLLRAPGGAGAFRRGRHRETLRIAW
jgi:hypothetical protein